MGFYNDVILPKVCDLAMRNKQLRPYRERVIGAAEGRVLEIGIGSGRNLPFYRPQVTELLALEPSPQLTAMARHAGRPDIPVNFVEASAEAIPLDDRSVDSRSLRLPFDGILARHLVGRRASMMKSASYPRPRATSSSNVFGWANGECTRGRGDTEDIAVSSGKYLHAAFQLQRASARDVIDV